MNIYDLKRQNDDAIERNSERELNLREDARAILDTAKASGRDYLTRDEDSRWNGIMRDIEQCRAAGKRLAMRAPEIDRAMAEDELADEGLRNATVPASLPKRNRTASVSVIRNERTYNPGVDAECGASNNLGGAFLLDVGRAAMGDYSAQERLQRHQREEMTDRPWLAQRASSTSGNYSGLVVPAYVTQDAAPAVAAARPLADVMNGRELPPNGMSVNISRITTPSAAGIQTTENTNVTSQAMDDTLLTLNVETAAGTLTVSRQAVERGTGIEEIVMSDLLARVAVSLEQQLISEASVGLAALSTSQTYTNATVDTTAVPTFLKQLPQAQNTLDINLLAYSRPGVVVMHPRRFNWLTAASSSSWPMLTGVSTPTQAYGLQLTNDYGPAVRAVMSNGMKIVVDANVTTAGLATALTGGTQDHVYAIVAEQAYLYEPPERIVMIRAEQPAAASLGILYVAYEYFAYTFGRYSGQAVLINGTGLATPSFA